VGLNWFLPWRGGRCAASGRARTFMFRLAPTWVYSPFHRLLQVAFLALFFVLLLHVARPAPGVHEREPPPAHLLLALDPLVGVSAALAARAWVRPMVGAAVVLLACLVVPRAFCGYVCPLGTLADAFDWAVGRWARVLHVRRRRWFVHLRYYVLTAALAAAAAGVLLSGFVSPIPVLTRGVVAIVGAGAGWGGPVGWSRWTAAGLLAFVLCTGLLGRRFWCRYLCPSGALLSLAGLLRLTGRKVDSSCVRCGRCVDACPLGAVREDFSTRAADCTFCQVCGGVCPVGAISFGSRWRGGSAMSSQADAGDVPISRRALLAGAVGGAGAALAIGGLGTGSRPMPIRPPGSLPEGDFLATCVRCAECVKACPTGVLEPGGLDCGLLGLWTPRADVDNAACDPECHNCGQVCPTGAIRRLPLAEKRAARMGLAVVDEGTCNLCGECAEACPYEAVYWTPDALPFVMRSVCVGCGACQVACYALNVRETGELSRSAIVVEAGDGKDDRIRTGSYVALHIDEPRETPPTTEPEVDLGGALFDDLFE